MAPTEMPPNEVGLTHYNEWCDWGDTLEEQLSKGNIAYQKRELSDLSFYAFGTVELLMYVSPRTGKHVVVLSIPQRYEVDSFAQQYYIFEGMSADQADVADWLTVLRVARSIKDEEMQRLLSIPNPKDEAMRRHYIERYKNGGKSDA